MNANFEKMCRRNGGYLLPWLITLTNGTTTLRYINDTVSRIYETNTYAASTLSYSPNAQEHGFNGGGTLEIAASDANEVNSLIVFVDESTSVQLDVVGVLLENNTVSEIRTFRHNYGTVRLDGRKANFTFDADDRLTMTFPALIFSHYNNRGNR